MGETEGPSLSDHVPWRMGAVAVFRPTHRIGISRASSLHKQIFFVGPDDIVHHQGEDIPFTTFIDVGVRVSQPQQIHARALPVTPVVCTAV